MKALLLACALLVSIPAVAADGWNTQDWNTWKQWNKQPERSWETRPQQQREDFLQRRQGQLQEYQRQWSYDQRNRGYLQESQPDRYRADDYYNYGTRRYNYRTP